MLAQPLARKLNPHPHDIYRLSVPKKILQTVLLLAGFAARKNEGALLLDDENLTAFVVATARAHGVRALYLAALRAHGTRDGLADVVRRAT